LVCQSSGSEKRPQPPGPGAQFVGEMPRPRPKVAGMTARDTAWAIGLLRCERLSAGAARTFLPLLARAPIIPGLRRLKCAGAHCSDGTGRAMQSWRGRTRPNRKQVMTLIGIGPRIGGLHRSVEAVISGIPNCICHECGGAISIRAHNFRCQDRCGENWWTVSNRLPPGKNRSGGR
jgi:hypothetical protein